jgi:hypothetical protein
MDALTLLTADHNRVKGMFARFQKAEEEGDTATMAEVAPDILTDLEVHTTIEEEVFYPALRGKNEELDDLVKESLEEHAVAKDLMSQLRGMSPDHEQFAPKMKVLIENVEHHVTEEESEMWTQVRKALDKPTLEGLSQGLEARKIDLTDEALRKLASEQQIPGRSKMNHDELAATVAPS